MVARTNRRLMRNICCTQKSALWKCASTMNTRPALVQECSNRGSRSMTGARARTVCSNVRVRRPEMRLSNRTLTVIFCSVYRSRRTSSWRRYVLSAAKARCIRKMCGCTKIGRMWVTGRRLRAHTYEHRWLLTMSRHRPIKSSICVRGCVRRIRVSGARGHVQRCVRANIHAHIVCRHQPPVHARAAFDRWWIYTNRLHWPVRRTLAPLASKLIHWFWSHYDIFFVFF